MRDHEGDDLAGHSPDPRDDGRLRRARRAGRADRLAGPGALAIDVGDQFGPSSWVAVTQERIDAFADATGDRQWIHVDQERAASGPFGGTIGHGYLTLSLVPAMSYEVLPRTEGAMGINYGLNKVRFPAPVPSGSRVRGTFRLVALEEAEWGAQATWAVTIEREGGDKPVCVAEVVFRSYAPGPDAPLT